MKSIVVQKFGGTSVADIEKMRHVADVIIQEKENGNDVVVVVSAMGHTTDHLVKLAHEINPHPSERELDMLLSTGECVSMSLLTMALQSKGYKAISYNAQQIGIITENVHTKARIIDIKTDKLRKSLDDGNIIVIAGFQGVTTEGEITTLGRGGSDTSAVAIASALGAERCDIYTVFIRQTRELCLMHQDLKKFLTKKCLNLLMRVQMFCIPAVLKRQNNIKCPCGCVQHLSMKIKEL